MEAAFVFVSLFIIIFGIAYLHFSTRNKERLALIEKGADASIFMQKRSRETSPIWKILLLNLGLLLIGIGLGVIVAIALVTSMQLEHGGLEGPVYTSSIFMMAGVALVTGFFLSRKLIK